jgi:solute carrier family 25 phosphate transporter 3
VSTNEQTSTTNTHIHFFSLLCRLLLLDFFKLAFIQMFSQFGASPIGLFGRKNTLRPLATSPTPLATSGASGLYNWELYDFNYFLKGALAGGLCCSITHGGLVPVDVVKTRIQLNPEKYNRGMVGGFKQIIAEEGTGALASGFGPTAVGYFIQGWFKFGGVEFFKINFTKSLGDETAWNNKTPIYLLSAACAEFIADIFLCPLEATRIRLVSQPDFGSGLMDSAPKIMKQDGFMKGFYSGFGPILFKQVPYTMAKFAVQGKAQDMTCAATGLAATDLVGSKKLMMGLWSGTIAGVAAAIISHPADTLLSLINKSETAGGTGSTTSRLKNLATEMGFKKLCLTGLGARCVMIGSLTAGQFAIFDIVLDLTGASKFHFHNPADPHH